MDIETPSLEQQIQRTWPAEIWRDTRTLVAVSGGADSVALLRALVQLAARRELIDVAHFNHCYRGEASDGDQQFVIELGRELGVRVHVARADETKGDPLGKSEESARDARYEFLTAVAYKNGARYVVTAHTATDRVETLLHNVFRGTGLAGASTPTLARPLHHDLVLVRPLLGCTRTQVIDYLAGLGQNHRTDSSNENIAFRRNFIRNSLLPLIRQEYGELVDERILSFSEIAEEAHNLQQQLAGEYLEAAERLAREAFAAGSLTTLDRSLFVFPTHSRTPAAWPVVRQALYFVWLDRKWPLQKMSRPRWEEIRSIWHDAPNDESNQGVQNLPGNLRLSRNGDFVLIVGLK